MEDRHIEENTEALLQDLADKVISLNWEAQELEGASREKADGIIAKVVKVFDDVSARLKELPEGEMKREDTIAAIDTVKEKSAALYDSALKKLRQLKEAAQVPNEAEEVKETEITEEEKEDEAAGTPETEETAEADGVGEEETEAAKEETGVSGKTLEILKGWLLKEGEDQ